MNRSTPPQSGQTARSDERGGIVAAAAHSVFDLDLRATAVHRALCNGNVPEAIRILHETVDRFQTGPGMVNAAAGGAMIELLALETKFGFTEQHEKLMYGVLQRFPPGTEPLQRALALDLFGRAVIDWPKTPNGTDFEFNYPEAVKWFSAARRERGDGEAGRSIEKCNLALMDLARGRAGDAYYGLVSQMGWLQRQSEQSISKLGTGRFVVGLAEAAYHLGLMKPAEELASHLVRSRLKSLHPEHVDCLEPQILRWRIRIDSNQPKLVAQSIREIDTMRPTIERAYGRMHPLGLEMETAAILGEWRTAVSAFRTENCFSKISTAWERATDALEALPAGPTIVRKLGAHAIRPSVLANVHLTAADIHLDYVVTAGRNDDSEPVELALAEFAKAKEILRAFPGQDGHILLARAHVAEAGAHAMFGEHDEAAHALESGLKAGITGASAVSPWLYRTMQQAVGYLRQTERTDRATYWTGVIHELWGPNPTVPTGSFSTELH